MEFLNPDLINGLALLIINAFPPAIPAAAMVIAAASIFTSQTPSKLQDSGKWYIKAINVGLKIANSISLNVRKNKNADDK